MSGYSTDTARCANCDHREDDHDDNTTKAYRRCLVQGCECQDFEESGDD